MAALREWSSRKAKVGIFDRLRKASSNVDNEVDLINSIKENLNFILNARPGECQGSPDLGIIDFNDAMMSSEELQRSVCESIKQCIDSYEPRIHTETINIHQDSLTFYYIFSIVAYLVNDKAMDKKIDLSIHFSNNKFKVY